MNNQLIEKVISSNNEECPELNFDNPVIDRDVASALARGFVKVLKISEPDNQVNKNLRLSVLENIKKLCIVEPENHLKIDDNFTESLVEFYQNQTSINVKTEDTLDKKLDAFLIKTMKESYINSSFGSSLNPEVVQAMINLSDGPSTVEKFSREFIHWNTENKKCLAVMKNLWNNSDGNLTNLDTIDDISVKMKPDIEKLLLNICHSVLFNPDIDIEHAFNCNTSLKNLIRTCTLSPNCYQICYGVLHFLFLQTNFNLVIFRIISTFVRQVYANYKEPTISLLYPINFSSAVLLLDMEPDELPADIKDGYALLTISHLEKVHQQSENDLVLLLSHFPQWFDIYFSHKNGSK